MKKRKKDFFQSNNIWQFCISLWDFFPEKAKKRMKCFFFFTKKNFISISFFWFLKKIKISRLVQDCQYSNFNLVLLLSPSFFLPSLFRFEKNKLMKRTFFFPRVYILRSVSPFEKKTLKLKKNGQNWKKRFFSLSLDQFQVAFQFRPVRLFLKLRSSPSTFLPTLSLLEERTTTTREAGSSYMVVVASFWLVSLIRTKKTRKKKISRSGSRARYTFTPYACVTFFLLT